MVTASPRATLYVQSLDHGCRSVLWPHPPLSLTAGQRAGGEEVPRGYKGGEDVLERRSRGGVPRGGAVGRSIPSSFLESGRRFQRELLPLTPLATMAHVKVASTPHQHILPCEVTVSSKPSQQTKVRLDDSDTQSKPTPTFLLP